jgi:outer membrane receptor for ferrienterochelin and colicins
MDGPIGAGRRRPARLVALWSLLGALSSASLARAEDDDLAELLDEHVVSGASRTSELAKDAPATTAVITSEEIARYGIRSLAEAIDFLGMGLITQDPLHSVEVGGRGVLVTSDFGSHVLLIVDGHVFNEPWDGTAYFEQGSGIPLEIIDHIELILGPGSVLYGGNAVIGVINVVTKRGAANRGLHLMLEGSASPQQGRNGNFTSFAPADIGGSYRLGLGYGHELPFLGPRAEINIAAELYHQDGPTFEWGPQSVTNEDGSPYNFGPRTPPGLWGGRIEDQYNTLVPTLYSRLHIGDFSVMFRGTLYRRATPVQGFDQHATDFDEERSWERDRWLSLDVQYEKRIAQKLELSARGYADAYDYYQQMYNTEPSVCDPPTTGPCLFVGKGRSKWIGSELQASYDWTEEDRYTTLFGLNGTLRSVGGETDSVEGDTGEFLGGLRNDVTETVWAAYLQQRLAPTPFLHFNLGARYDADPRGGSRLSPRAAVAVDVWEGGVLKLIYAEAFRPPTFYEGLFTYPDEIPNPSIRSEYVRGIESTFEQRVGRNNFLVGVFRTRWSEMLSLEPTDSGLYQYQNSSDIENYGVNASVRGALDSFHYGASIVGAHTRRVTPDGEQPLPASPQVFGNARVSYSLPAPLPTIAFATTFVGRRPADRLLDGNFVPAPYAPSSVQLRLTLSQQVPAVPGLSYRVGGSYTTGDVVPYVAGPIQSYDDPESTAPGPAELTPVVKLVGFATLRYDLPL